MSEKRSDSCSTDSVATMYEAARDGAAVVLSDVLQRMSISERNSSLEMNERWRPNHHSRNHRPFQWKPEFCEGPSRVLIRHRSPENCKIWGRTCWGLCTVVGCCYHWTSWCCETVNRAKSGRRRKNLDQLDSFKGQLLAMGALIL